MPCIAVLFYCLELDSSKCAILDIGHLLSRRMVHDIILHLDEVPVLAKPRWLHLRDAALASQNLIVNRNDMVLPLLQSNSDLVLFSPVDEHPVIAELVVEHLSEVRRFVGIEVVELDAVLVENAAQRDHSVGDLEVLELVHLVHRRVVLLLHVAVLRLQQDRLRQGQQLVAVLYFLLIAHLLLNFR